MPARTNSKELWRAILWLCLLPLVLVGPALLPGSRFLPLAPVALEPLASENPSAAALAWRGVDFLGSDALFPMLSDAQQMRAALQRGELPLWDPKIGLGAPLFAQTMFGALYPPHWLAFLFEPDVALGWIALIDLVLAGLGIFLFTRRLGVSFGAALVGAAVFQTAGFASANLHDLMKVEAGLWLPWTLLAIERVQAGEKRALVLLASSVALSFLAGFVPIAIFCSVAAAAYALVRALSRPGGGLRLWRCGAGLLIGIAIAAIQLVPMAEARAQSTRSVREDPRAAVDGLPLGANLTLVAPELFGRADEAVFAPCNSAAWWLARASEKELAFNANLLEWNLFAGSLALALAAAALFARPRAALFPAGLAVVSLAFAQGWPVLDWLRVLPGLDLGSPARAGVLAWTAWAWLAAIGADALLQRERRVVAAAWTCGAFLILGLLLAFAVEPAQWVAQLPQRLAERFEVTRQVVDNLLSAQELLRAAERVCAAGRTLIGFATLALLCTLGFLLTPRAPRWAPGWLSLFLVAGAEGTFYARVHLAPRAIESSVWPQSASMDALREAAGDGRVLRLDESESGVSEVLDLARPNLPQAYGIADLSPYVVFTPRRAVELWSRVDRRALWRNGTSRISDPALLDHPVLDVLRVTALLSRHPLKHPRLVALLEREGFCVYRRTGVPARARIVNSSLRAPTERGVVDALATRLSDPARQTVLPPSAAEWECAAAAPGGTVQIVASRAQSVSIDTRGTARGWLVLADAWYPGWRARLDGREVEIVAVDHALRGVALDAGDHTLEFEYEPGSLRLGAWISAFAIALLIAFSRRRPDALPVS